MKAKLTKRTVDALKPDQARYTVHDTELRGFQVRVEPTGRITYMVYYRTQSRQERRFKIGEHGVIAAEEARTLARKCLGEVRAGRDPAGERKTTRQSATVAELCEAYLGEHATAQLKPSTVKTYRWLVEKCIAPHIGTKKVVDLGRADVEGLRRSLSSTPRNANQSISLLRTVFRRAESLGEMPSGPNPCAGVRPFVMKRLDRFLSDAEVERLARTLDAFEHEQRASIYALAAIRLLLTTGCRKNEICRLRWSEVDLERRELRLEDSKTGAKRLPLNSAAVDILATIPQLPDNEYVIAGTVPGASLVGLQRIWERIRNEANLDDVRIHDLRHTFASIAINNGTPMAHVGKLLGHATPQATSRYAHLADEPLRQASESVGRAVIQKNAD